MAFYALPEFTVVYIQESSDKLHVHVTVEAVHGI